MQEITKNSMDELTKKLQQFCAENEIVDMVAIFSVGFSATGLIHTGNGKPKNPAYFEFYQDIKQQLDAVAIIQNS